MTRHFKGLPPSFDLGLIHGEEMSAYLMLGEGNLHFKLNPGTRNAIRPI